MCEVWPGAGGAGVMVAVERRLTAAGAEVPGAFSNGNPVEALAVLCQANEGKATLGTALAALVAALGAQGGAFVRCTGPHARQTVAAACEPQAGHVRPCAAAGSEVPAFPGPDFGHAGGGSLWIASRDLRSGAGEPGDWMAARGLSDLGVIVLSRAGSRRDHLELHFRERLSSGQEQLLHFFAPAIARAWSGRRNGGMSDSPEVAGARGGRSNPKLDSEPLLGPSNPAKLSRAEFRVCLLLSRGCSVQGVCEELSLAEATVRSHLRNIYAKTETEGLLQLTLRLATDSSGDALPA